MDFFDTLRKGCAFGSTKRSKHVVFSKTLQQQPESGQKRHKSAGQVSQAKANSPLDFFGYGADIAPCSGTGEGNDAEPKAEQDDDDSGAESKPGEGADEALAGAAVDTVGATGAESKTATEAPVKRASVLREEVAALRRKCKIHVGAGAPDPVGSFDAMSVRGVPPWLVSNLRSLGFARPTPIQMQCFPAVMAGSHVLASAPTGSGKTIAFLGPLLARMAKPGKEFARTVVVDPSRELAKQTLDEFVKLTKGRKWSGRLIDKLGGEKNKGIKRLDIAIATPLRLATMLREDRISLDSMQHFVLDEADKLLDLGFAPQIDEILSYCPKSRAVQLQTLMFSATLPPVVCELANSILTNPMRVSIGTVNAAAPDVEQKLLFITDEDGKLFSFRQLVQEGKVKPPALIFVQSKERAKQLFGELIYDGVFADAIHGDRTKQQRDNSVRAFREGKTWMLICTDVMARGIDFKGVETVINYDFPVSASTYIHRIGRTGRAGRAGEAVTFFTISDFEHLRSIVSVMRQSGCEVPDWMLRLKPQKKDRKRNAEFRPVFRKRISTVSGWDLQKRHKKQQIVQHSKKRKGKSQAQE